MVIKSPSELWKEIRCCEVPSGKLVFWWLHQAGTILKTAGTIVAVDPYLSGSVMRSYRQPRNVPAPQGPFEANVDALIATHSHEDHLDPDSIAAFLSHDTARFVGPPMAVKKVVATGVESARTTPIRRGRRKGRDLTVRAVRARHLVGIEPTPDAVEYMLESDEVSV